MKDTIKDVEKDDEILLTRTSCTGQCGKGPIVIVYPKGVWYREVTPKIGVKIISEHICGGEIVKNRVLVQLEENINIQSSSLENTNA
jgi:(2Fe-2S) ferredoxin